jgi:hypothetical protein
VTNATEDSAYDFNEVLKRIRSSLQERGEPLQEGSTIPAELESYFLAAAFRIALNISAFKKTGIDPGSEQLDIAEKDMNLMLEIGRLLFQHFDHIFKRPQ